MLDEKALILIVHPDVETLTSLYSALDRGGHLVATTSSGRDALKVVCERKPHLLISSIRLPDMAGRVLLKAVCEASPWTSLVLLTDTTGWLVDFEAPGAEGHAVLRLPMDLENVIGSVDRLLEGASAKPHA